MFAILLGLLWGHALASPSHHNPPTRFRIPIVSPTAAHVHRHRKALSSGAQRNAATPPPKSKRQCEEPAMCKVCMLDAPMRFVLIGGTFFK